MDKNDLIFILIGIGILLFGIIHLLIYIFRYELWMHIPTDITGTNGLHILFAGIGGIVPGIWFVCKGLLNINGIHLGFFHLNSSKIILNIIYAALTILGIILLLWFALATVNIIFAFLGLI